MAAKAGLISILVWPAFGYLLLGIGIGMFLGLSVGLSGLTGLALLLPFAFGKSPAEAFAFLLGMFSVTTLTDVVPAIMMGIPGTAAAQAIIVDGYPMARRGEAGRAMGAAFMSDVIGSLVGAGVFIVCIPVIRAIVTHLGAPEFFTLGLLGMSMVGLLSGSSVVRGLIIGFFGLLVSTVGMAPEAGFPRYNLGLLYLWNGVPLVPSLLGLFALPEIIQLVATGQTISRVDAGSTRGVAKGMLDALHHWWLVVRCSLIGAWTGLIPGLGGPVVEWLGYGHAVQSSGMAETFGKGDVRGIIGAESATVAHKPGGLIPTVAFGIPGSPPFAILLGAFLIVGLTPGVNMLTTHLPVTFAMIWTTVIANIIAAVAALALAGVMAKVAHVRPEILAPLILVGVAVGSVSATGSLDDLMVAFAFGVLGLVLERTGWPRPPFALGLVLGAILEGNLFISVEAYGFSWLGRPIVVALLIVILGSIFGVVLGRRAQRRRLGGERRVAVRGRRYEWRPSHWIALLMAVMGGAAVIDAWPWELRASLFPDVVAATIFFLSLAELLTGFLPAAPAAAAASAAAEGGRADLFQWRRVLEFCAWVIGFALCLWVFGFALVVPVFIGLMLLLWARERPVVAIGLALAGWAFVYLVVEHSVHMTMPVSLLSTWLP